MALFKTRPETDALPVRSTLAWSMVAERQIDEMLGLCKGMLADGEVNESEAAFLLSWLEANRHAADKWPANVIYPRIQTMLSDGVFDADEERELLELLMEITGSAKVAATGCNASTTLPLDDPSPKVAFPCESFCLTGTFALGSRKEVEAMVQSRGGVIHAKPTKTTGFLVVGEVGSRDWVHSTFGRKIETAVELREQGCRIAIVSEQHFVEYL